MRYVILALTLCVAGCATPPASVSKVYAVDVCAERDDPTDCVNRLAARQCPNGANDLDAYRDERRRLHVDVGCD